MSRWLYVDFDGFFAAVEEQSRPDRHGRPLAVVASDGVGASTISANAAAKRLGVSSHGSAAEAKRICPSLILVLQRPDVYMRAHHWAVSAVDRVLPVDAACSVDELVCRMDGRRPAPEVVSELKGALREALGPRVTASVGVAPTRWLAKTVCSVDKPDGCTVVDDLPGSLLALSLEDLPGVGPGILARMHQAGVRSVEDLWGLPLPALRAVWGGVQGARFWRLLHGEDIPLPQGPPRSVGHARILPPRDRVPERARRWARALTVRAARRLRRQRLTTQRLVLEGLVDEPRAGFSLPVRLRPVSDDASCLRALGHAWRLLSGGLPPRGRLYSVAVWLDRLEPVRTQGELFPDPELLRSEAISRAVDGANARYGRSVVGFGSCAAGDYVGGKIAFGRLPEPEDYR